MNRRDFLRCTGASVAAMAVGQAAREAEGAAGPTPDRPNIIFILSDDVGYGDLSCYGATKLKTPNLDRLAGEGVRFTDAHAPSAMCSPTRYGVLTGCYPWRKGIPGALSGVAPLTIAPGSPTLPSLLQQAGYTTGAVGKWHLGLGSPPDGPDFNGELKPGPLEIGFDYFFGYPATNDRVPSVYIENRRVVGLDPADPIQVSYGKKVGSDPVVGDPGVELKLKSAHGHNNTVVNGIGRIGFMSGGKKARFVDEDMGDTLLAKATAFIERSAAAPPAGQAGAARKPFFLYYAMHHIHAPRVPHPRFKGTSQCGTRGDDLQEMDWAAGEIMKTLDRLGQAQNTLVIFSSDNGGTLVDGYDDGGERDANGHKANGPLRGGKYSLYEGGTRVPFIARWPGRIKPHSTSEQLICLIDLLATFHAVARPAGQTGQDLPADAGPDSFNVLPALLGQPADKPVRDHLVEHVGGGPGLAIRKGTWKFIPTGQGRGAGKKGKAGKKGDAGQADPDGEADRPAGELYDLSKDLGETTNVAAQHPQVAKELSDLLHQVRQKGRSRA